MKKYLISLDKDSQRRALFFSQPNTEDFEVFSAINTMQVALNTLAERFDFAQFNQRYHRSVTQGEIGCTLSHLAVYQQIAENPAIDDNAYILVCEDDVLFCPNFYSELNKLIPNAQGDILLVGQSKITQFNDIELEINYPTTFRALQKKAKTDRYLISYPYKNYFAGTVAYLIKKSAAKKILSQQNPLPHWLADDFILFGSKFNLDIQIVRPLMAIENLELMSNLEAVRGSISHSLFKKLIKYPLKKCLAIKRNWGI